MAFGAFASRALTRIGQGARQALVRARDLARSPPGADAALADLDETIRRYAGTPYEADLLAVRDYLEKTKRFPDIPELR
jgi:hypothetical protein